MLEKKGCTTVVERGWGPPPGFLKKEGPRWGGSNWRKIQCPPNTLKGRKD